MRRKLLGLLATAAAIGVAWVVLDRASTLLLDDADEDENDIVESGCGYEYDHQVRVVDLETGQWECTRCGAEGWDE